MNRGTKITLLALGTMLLGLAACSNSTSGPNYPPPPPPPSGAITCDGHAEIYREAGASTVTDFWYAYWLEPRDSAPGTLEFGIIDTRLRDTIRDTLYLDRSVDSLEFAPIDWRAQYYDSTMIGVETSDSLIVGFGYFEGSGQTYFFKKLH